MNAIDRLTHSHACSEQLARALVTERHVRRAVREELVSEIDTELACEADLVARAAGNGLPTTLSRSFDADFLADRSQLRRAVDDLAAAAVDAPEFTTCANAVVDALARHRAHQTRWLFPFLAANLLEARDTRRAA